MEMEFDLGFYLHIPYFNDMDFLEFQWKFERVQKEKQRLNGKKNIADGSNFG